jgi:hypothetical protein
LGYACGQLFFQISLGNQMKIHDQANPPVAAIPVHSSLQFPGTGEAEPAADHPEARTPDRGKSKY